MQTHSNKRYALKFEDSDLIEDVVFDSEGQEHLVTLCGKQWKDYDWILTRYEDIAKRLVSQSSYIVNRKSEHKSESTLSTVLSVCIHLFVTGYHENKNNPPDPLEDVLGSA